MELNLRHSKIKPCKSRDQYYTALKTPEKVLHQNFVQLKWSQQYLKFLNTKAFERQGSEKVHLYRPEGISKESFLDFLKYYDAYVKAKFYHNSHTKDQVFSLLYKSQAKSQENTTNDDNKSQENNTNDNTKDNNKNTTDENQS
jgi:hypothetical protein